MKTLLLWNYSARIYGSAWLVINHVPPHTKSVMQYQDRQWGQRSWTYRCKGRLVHSIYDDGLSVRWSWRHGTDREDVSIGNCYDTGFIRERPGPLGGKTCPFTDVTSSAHLLPPTIRRTTISPLGPCSRMGYVLPIRCNRVLYSLSGIVIQGPNSGT